MVLNTSRYVLAYGCWALSVALAIVDLLVWRNSAMIVLGMTPWDRYVEHALNQFGFLFLAIAGLAVIVFTEHFYRTGVEKNRLFVRFFLVTLIGLLVFMLAHLVRLIGELVLGFFAPATLLLVLVELAVCVLVFWFYRQAQQKARTDANSFTAIQ
ncbi:MAG: hypothetical protein M3Q45_14505 [Chloroflexota bacterium]|nr:hypothetical protein [Chloroflexota bacterium]